MSNSEVDDITRETSRAARAAGRAVATFLTRAQSRHPGKPITQWSDLSRAERKQMKGEVSRALRDERRREETEASDLRRDITDSVHAHHTRVWEGYRPRENEQMSDWFARQQDRERELRELEEWIAAAKLSDTERGQAVTTLRRAHYLPMYKSPQEIFVPTSGTRSLWERMQAGLSRLRLGRARDGEHTQLQNWENTQQNKARASFPPSTRELGTEHERRRQRLVADQQNLTREHRGDYSREHAEFDALRHDDFLDTEYTRRQVFAVQDLRQAQHRIQAEQESGITGRSDQAWANAVDRAAASGLSREQIAWELDNVETNSRCETTLTYTVPAQPGTRAYQQRMTGLHADEAEAARWARLTLNRYAWEQGTQFEITATERGQRTPFFATSGGYLRASADVRGWAQQATEQELHRIRERGHNQPNPTLPAEQPHTHTENAQVTEPTGSAARGASEDVHINGRTVVADSIGGIGNTGSVGRRTARTSEGTRSGRPTAGVTATAANGARSTVTAEGVHITGRSQVVAGNIGGNGNHSSPTLLNHARNTQAQARQQATQARLQQQVDQLTQERDRFRAERDEAVTKLVETTPPEQRYGSPHRRAAEKQRQDQGVEADQSIPDDRQVYVFGQELRDRYRTDPVAWAQFVNQNVPESKREHWLRNPEAFLDFHETVEDEMRQAAADKDSPIIARISERLEDQHPDTAGQEFANWWVSGGVDEYRDEKKSRETEDQAPPPQEEVEEPAEELTEDEN